MNRITLFLLVLVLSTLALLPSDTVPKSDSNIVIEYQYLAIASYPGDRTYFHKLDQEGNTVQTASRPQDSLSLGGFVTTPVPWEGDYLLLASASERNMDYGFLRLDPDALTFTKGEGVRRATSIAVAGNACYTASAAPNRSRFCKTDLGTGSTAFKEDLPLVIYFLYEDHDLPFFIGCVWTGGGKTTDPIVYHIDPDTLETTPFVQLPSADIVPSVLPLEDRVLYGTSWNGTGGIEAFCRESGSLSHTDLPFSSTDLIFVQGDSLWAVCQGRPREENASAVRLDPDTLEPLETYPLSYYATDCLARDDLLVTLDGETIREYSLPRMELIRELPLPEGRNWHILIAP